MTYEEHRIREAERGGPRGAQRRAERRRAQRLTESGRLADDHPLILVRDNGREEVEQWTEWYHRRVQRARRARARAAGPNLPTVAPAGGLTRGDHRRAPKPGRRRSARRVATRSSSDDPGGEPGPQPPAGPFAGGRP